MPKDRKTKYQSIYARHQTRCSLEKGGKRCNCTPSYFGRGSVAGQRAHTDRFPGDIEAARNAYADVTLRLTRGETLATGGGVTLTQARKRFCEEARAGLARNKNGAVYKPTAIYDIEISLTTHVEPTLGSKRLRKITRSDIQTLVNTLQTKRSGSRVRSVVNSLRALYTWAQGVDLVPDEYEPARRIRLPALDTQETGFVGPAEFAAKLAALPVADQVPYALGAYALARREQTRYLSWPDIDWERETVALAEEEAAAKTAAARRAVPIVPPLLSVLKRAWLEAGRPTEGRVVRPRYHTASGLYSANGLAKRAKRRWAAARLEPITLTEARHSGSTWLAGAGVHPKLHSYFMGHKTTTQGLDGGAALTQNTYTHVLWADVERASQMFAAYVAAGQQRASL